MKQSFCIFFNLKESKELCKEHFALTYVSGLIGTKNSKIDMIDEKGKYKLYIDGIRAPRDTPEQNALYTAPYSV